ncbi:AraC family transcriptional regulator [Azospirillum thiophilum]|uniref:AraC family transcriptional regulator n=1 Tax=Azospirillum thiophilum TaxID=528244 RepID=A0AAC8W585_9PROT|nr:AraC family transcriptional regulator [Azospirillum thiophilum]ALG75358.1 AraC family transcriptional regulator [Azospirillum thiophilum]KJR62273.1 AraC family transcriptional regulator [Azospirillum thiophilum]
MILSQSSREAADPLSDVLDVLGPRISRLTRLEAANDWSLEFPALDRLKFVALLKGTSWLILPDHAPRLMGAGDVCLIGRTPYAVASDPALPRTDGRSLFGSPGRDAVQLGGSDMISIGGSVSFAEGNADFLLDMLPDFLLIPRSSPGSGSVATILALLGDEMAQARLGRGIVTARLAEVLLVEAVRAHADGGEAAGMGWLGALSDPRLGRVLRAVHDDIARPWTVAQLASVANMSRAAFSAHFTRRVGQAPLAYVRAWRLTLARAALGRGDADVASIASKVGYTSQSAFGHAFRRSFGISPRACRQGRPLADR